jgi:glycosidase
MMFTTAIAASVLVTPKMTMEERAKDWRNGAIVYQVFVDRFVPPTNVTQQKAYYQAPRVFKTWDQLPKAGKLLPEEGVWSHELEFWGGDLMGVATKLDYIQKLGADVLYLNPIHEAFTNHKYDASVYMKIDPAFGTMQDFQSLLADAHDKKLKVVLDGVFNHCGKRSPVFQDALKNPQSPYRDWFYISDEYKNGYKGWVGGTNLPVNRIENPAVSRHLWSGFDSVVQGFLQLGIDGWRLDVAYELGDDALAEITQASHKVKEGSLVVGEMLGYPAGWQHCVDGQYNLFANMLWADLLAGNVTGRQASELLNDWIADAGIEHALKSWIVMDNHDTPRMATQYPLDADRFLAMGLMMTLPGSPNIYYGSELGMVGGGDPENRAPMRWDLASKPNATSNWIKKLIKVRKAMPALKYGDFQALRTEKLLAYTRTTGKLRENAIVVFNPTAKPVKETFSHRIGNLMSWQKLTNVLGKETVIQKSGLMTVEVPAKGMMIFKPVTDSVNGFSPYDRIK